MWRYEEILALLRWKEEELRSDAGPTVWSEEESESLKHRRLQERRIAKRQQTDQGDTRA